MSHSHTTSDRARVQHTKSCQNKPVKFNKSKVKPAKSSHKSSKSKSSSSLEDACTTHVQLIPLTRSDHSINKQASRRPNKHHLKAKYILPITMIPLIKFTRRFPLSSVDPRSGQRVCYISNHHWAKTHVTQSYEHEHAQQETVFASSLNGNLRCRLEKSKRKSHYMKRKSAKQIKKLDHDEATPPVLLLASNDEPPSVDVASSPSAAAVASTAAAVSVAVTCKQRKQQRKMAATKRHQHRVKLQIQHTERIKMQNVQANSLESSCASVSDSTSVCEESPSNSPVSAASDGTSDSSALHQSAPASAPSSQSQFLLQLVDALRRYKRREQSLSRESLNALRTLPVFYSPHAKDRMCEYSSPSQKRNVVTKYASQLIKLARHDFLHKLECRNIKKTEVRRAIKHGHIKVTKPKRNNSFHKIFVKFHVDPSDMRSGLCVICHVDVDSKHLKTQGLFIHIITLYRKYNKHITSPIAQQINSEEIVEDKDQEVKTEESNGDEKQSPHCDVDADKHENQPASQSAPDLTSDPVDVGLSRARLACIRRQRRDQLRNDELRCHLLDHVSKRARMMEWKMNAHQAAGLVRASYNAVSKWSDRLRAKAREHKTRYNFQTNHTPKIILRRAKQLIDLTNRKQKKRNRAAKSNK